MSTSELSPSTRRPPTAAGGPARWIRHNLFRTPTDAVITVVMGTLAVWGLYRLLNFTFVTGRWEIVEVNLSAFVFGINWDNDDLWRLVLALVVFTTLGGLIAGVVARRQQVADAEAGIEPEQSGARVLDLATRFWPLVLGLLLMLLLARTITPWFVVLGAAAASVVGRLIGFRLPRRALVPLLGFALAAGIFMIWFLAQTVGWDDWGGLTLNIFLAAVSIVLCFPLGVVLALGRRSELPIIRFLSTTYIELFRGVPLLALLLMANTALGFFIPQSLAPGKVVRAIVVFVLFTAAYVAEIVRGGLQSVPRGQIEAGRAMGLSSTRVTALIVLPQALKNVIPALVGQFISLFKDTTLAGAAMGFVDLLSRAEGATAQDAFRGQALIPETLAFVLLLFWVGSYTMSRESQRFEKKLGVGER